jgi:iron complex transport system permease protein
MKSRYATIVLLGLICIVIAGFALIKGAYRIELSNVWSILVGRLFGVEGNWSASDQVVLLAVRLPRIILVVLVGASLAVSGAVLQATFRNPLVSPYLLGISSAASFGASVMMVFLLVYRPWLIQLSAFLFGMLAVFLASSIARLYDPLSNTVLILAGVVVSSLFSAMVGILKYLAPPETLRMIELWSMGSFASADWRDVLQVMPFAIIGCVLMVLLSWRINVLSLGEQHAATLGVNPKALRFVLVAVTSLMTSVSVAVCGPIGWVGIIIPHSMRMMVGANNYYVILGSICLGSAFLLLVDLCARTLLPGEIPISILTAIVGAAFFIVLVSRTRRGTWQQ